MNVMYSSRLLFFLMLFGCSLSRTPESYDPGIVIIERSPNRETALTKQNMLQLTKVYDLRPFLFTKKINVQSNTLPTSHPVLTLDTRFAESPHKLLALWLHGEFHWWSVKNVQKMRTAVSEITQIFPSTKEKNGHIHLIICYLDYEALSHFLGTNEATSILKDFIHKDKIYPWAYSMVLGDEAKLIRKIIEKNDLFPTSLK